MSRWTVLLVGILLLGSISMANASESMGGAFGAGPRYFGFDDSGVLSLKKTVGASVFFDFPLKKNLGPLSVISIENDLHYFKAGTQEVSGSISGVSIGQRLSITRYFLKNEFSSPRLGFRVGVGYLYHIMNDVKMDGTLQVLANQTGSIFDVSNAFGISAVAGVDYYFGRIGLVRFDVDYVTGTSTFDMRLPSGQIYTGDVSLKYVGFQIGVGFRF